MEVINESSALLSNYEVYSLLTDIQNGNGQKKPSKHQQNLATITYETVKYLESTPCRVQDQGILGTFCGKIAPYNLTKAEKLQLLNHRPTTAVEIQLIVEESEERLTEDQIYELLELVSTCVPSLDSEKETSAEPETSTDQVKEGETEEATMADDGGDDDDDDDEEDDVDVDNEFVTEDRTDVKVGDEEED